MAHYQDYGLAAPRGPDMTSAHDPVHQMTENEKQIFDYLIKPDDSYDTHGVYWADMPLLKRIKFITAYDAGEAGRELRGIWQMAKRDPLEPVMYYLRNMVIPGAGLGLEGYASPNILRSKSVTTNASQLRPLLHWQHQAPLPSYFRLVLEVLQDLQRDMGSSCGLPRDLRYHCRSNTGWHSR